MHPHPIRSQTFAIVVDQLARTMKSGWIALGCLLVPILLAPLPGVAKSIPESEITTLSAQLEEKNTGSAARRGLSLKRVIRGGEALLRDNPDAPNRFEVLHVLYRGQQELVAMDNSSRNRDALIETCRKLAVAPNDYAAIRLDADLMLSQVDLAKEGADLKARGSALIPLTERYRDTEIEAKVLRLAMLMALEFGDIPVVGEIRDMIAQRFPENLDLIIFQREHLKGQVFGAPFVGTFKQSDGKDVRFPLDGLGRSTMIYFWSKEDQGLSDLASLAKTCKENEEKFASRIRFVSVNVDELPDAGEKHLRDLNLDWPALHLTGGRNSKVFKAYGRGTPSMVTVTPTGYAALFMSAGRDGGVRDYARWAGSSMAREWNKERYGRHLRSIFNAEFMIMPMGEPFDPAYPPELKAVTGSKPLPRSANSVPEETLSAIQSCFVPMGLRSRLNDVELEANYVKADALSKQAIAEHPQAPDLWIVRNRRLAALKGLWKLTAQRDYYDAAVTESRTIIEQATLPGTDLLARFCVARESLRAADIDPKAVIGQFRSDNHPLAPGASLALGSILALDVADRQLHEKYRNELLETYAEEPMMWTPVSFMLDRHVRYWMYTAPYTGGWSFGRRQKYFMNLGHPDEVVRSVAGHFQDMDGKAVKIPADTKGKWQILVFAGDWTTYDRKPMPSLAHTMQSYATNRPNKDVEFSVVLLDDKAPKEVMYKDKPVACRMLTAPGGLNNPLLQKVGVLSEDTSPNALVIRPDGTIAAAVSAFAMQDKSRGTLIKSVIHHQDEQDIISLIEQGQAEKAKAMALALAPIWDPEAPENKRKRKPQYPNAHLRSRARAYLALKDYESAYRDAHAVVMRQSSVDGGMSLTTQELIDAEALRDYIKEAMDGE